LRGEKTGGRPEKKGRGIKSEGVLNTPTGPDERASEKAETRGAQSELGRDGREGARRSSEAVPED